MANNLTRIRMIRFASTLFLYWRQCIPVRRMHDLQQLLSLSYRDHTALAGALRIGWQRGAMLVLEQLRLRGPLLVILPWRMVNDPKVAADRKTITRKESPVGQVNVVQVEAAEGVLIKFQSIENLASAAQEQPVQGLHPADSPGRRRPDGNLQPAAPGIWMDHLPVRVRRSCFIPSSGHESRGSCDANQVGMLQMSDKPCVKVRLDHLDIVMAKKKGFAAGA